MLTLWHNGTEVFYSISNGSQIQTTKGMKHKGKKNYL